jgi:hypothetical protein
LLTLTPKADKALRALYATHLSEIRCDAPQLIKLLSQIATRRRNGDSGKQAYRCLDMVKRIRTDLKTGLQIRFLYEKNAASSSNN